MDTNILEGHKSFADINTGEAIEATQITKTISKSKSDLIQETKDKTRRSGTFYITYISYLLSALDIAGSKKAEILAYFLRNMDSNNVCLFKSKTDLAKKCNTNLPTIRNALKEFQSAKLINVVGTSIIVNPRLINNKSAAGEAYLIIKFQMQANDYDKAEEAKEKAALNAPKEQVEDDIEHDLEIHEQEEKEQKHE